MTLPFAIIGHHRSLDYGLSTEAWGPWTVDLLKGLVLTGRHLEPAAARADRMCAAVPAVPGRPSPGGLLGCLVMVGSFVYPVLVEPAFNHFTPLPDGPLRTDILQLADREHVHLDDVLVADASRRTTTLNAYVSGFGSTRRVVLYDNVVRDLPRGQILSIVAHELGHAHHDDVLTGSVLAALGTMLGHRAARARCCRWCAERRGLRDPTVVPLVAGARGDRDAGLEPGEQRAVAADRDARRRRLAGGDPRPGRRSRRCSASSTCTP